MDTEQLARLIDAAIGDELRAQRQHLKLSRAALEKLSGVSASTIQRVEEGRRSPDSQQLVKLTAALGTTMREFVNRALKDIEGAHDPEKPSPTSQPG
ncbi:helix-turn-helix domain-containing protein [Nocardia brasiliensis]|uniref:helix-turn-helix domain-containing protein n=1 Tax=Nocardia brasiliensis TaxID=37326 RepID=UPI002455F4CA|nr:helix-turn-helix transcriptional regulator [Nocardia brasiliensis]